MKAWSLAGCLLGGVVAVVGWAPARWLTSSLEQLSQQRVVLQEARGSVWSGSARLLLSAGPGSQAAVALPDRLTWHIHPQLLPTPSLSVSLSLPCCTESPVHFLAQAGWGGPALQVQDHRSTWPAAALAGLGTPWNTVQAQGRLELDTRGLEVRWVEQRLQVAGQASLGLIDLSSRLSTLHPMGSYRLQLQGNDGSRPLRVQLDTLNGHLHLQGQGEWTGERWRFQGEASASPAHEAALSNLLNVLGQRQGNKALLTMG
jgi:general secretion pathway protein N